MLPSAKSFGHGEHAYAYLAIEHSNLGDETSDLNVLTFKPPSTNQKDEKGRNKEHKVDLWTNGSIYPKDSFTNTPPPFCNVTNLLYNSGNNAQCLEVKGHF